MASWFARMLIVTSIAGASACGKRQQPPAHGGDAAAADGSSDVHSRYREMTWPEYYAEVTERVWKRGGTVVWISPPSVRKVKRDAAQGVR